MPTFFSSWFCKPKTKPYDYKQDILSRIQSNTIYVKSGIPFRENDFHWYGNYMILFSSSWGGESGLHLNIKNDDVILNESECTDECIVCTEEIKTTISCCKKPICMDCVKKIRETTDVFSCPHCRRVPKNDKCVVLRKPEFDYFSDDTISLDDKLRRVEELIS